MFNRRLTDGWSIPFLPDFNQIRLSNNLCPKEITKTYVTANSNTVATANVHRHPPHATAELHPSLVARRSARTLHRDSRTPATGMAARLPAG